MSKEDSLQSVYLDTSIFAGKVMMADQEDKQCAILLGKISSNEFNQFRFLTSKFTLIEIAELIARKVTEDKAKSTLFDLVYNPQIPIFLINPEPAHKTWARREYFDIDLLVANIVNTALKHRMPGFDTIHAHTIFTVGERIIAVSKDTHFQRFKNIKNVVDVVTATDFLKNYDIK